MTVSLEPPEADTVSELIPTPPPNPLLTERHAYERFARGDTAPRYREHLDRLYSVWHGFNRDFFDGRLSVPHISIGRTATRRFSQCRTTTNYGGQIDLTLSEAIAFATNRAVVRREYPAPGLVRFLDDLLLAATVKQFVLEVEGRTENGHGGYGPRYAAHATRIGAALGLPPVVARHRGWRGTREPLAATWPWAVRPDGYYLGDVRLDGRQVAGRASRPAGPANSVSVNAYFLFLLVTGHAKRLRAILERQVDRDREARHPLLAADERGPRHPDGTPKPVPALNPNWVRWNDDTPARIAAFVAERRADEVMPILADALQDAGCDDEDVLEHCRRPGVHTANCWVLRAIRTAAEIEEPTATDIEDE